MGALRILKGFAFWGAAAVTALVIGIPLAFVGLMLGHHYLGKHKFTLPIEGRVTDAVTGEPVPKLLVTADWTFRRPFSSYGWGERENALTDANGRFAIRTRDVSKPWSYFDGWSLQLRHPLYDFKMFRVEKRYGNAEPGVRVLKDKITIDTKVLKLEDRYSKPEDNAELSHHLGTIRPDFFNEMKRQFNVTYDVDAILEHVHYLASRYPNVAFQNGSAQLKSKYNEIMLSFGRTPRPLP